MTRDAEETRQSALRRENEALTNRLQKYQKLIDDLRSLPAKDGLVLLGGYRDNIDVKPGLFRAESPGSYRNPDYRILDQPLRQAQLIPVTSNLQADLLVDHSKAYPEIFPFENPQSIAKSLLNPSGSQRLEDITR